MSVSVHVYRHSILLGRYRDFTEILLTFVMSINGSSFPVNLNLLAQLWSQEKRSGKQGLIPEFS